MAEPIATYGGIRGSGRPSTIAGFSPGQLGSIAGYGAGRLGAPAGTGGLISGGLNLYAGNNGAGAQGIVSGLLRMAGATSGVSAFGGLAANFGVTGSLTPSQIASFLFTLGAPQLSMINNVISMVTGANPFQALVGWVYEAVTGQSPTANLFGEVNREVSQAAQEARGQLFDADTVATAGILNESFSDFVFGPGDSQANTSATSGLDGAFGDLNRETNSSDLFGGSGLDGAAGDLGYDYSGTTADFGSPGISGGFAGAGLDGAAGDLGYDYSNTSGDFAGYDSGSTSASSDGGFDYRPGAMGGLEAGQDWIGPYGDLTGRGTPGEISELYAGAGDGRYGISSGGGYANDVYGVDSE